MEWVKEWISNRVQYQTGSLRFASVSNNVKSFSIFASVVSETFYYQERTNLMSDVPEKLLITKAIYQLNKIQQSLAEYKFSQNTDFIYRRVPGIVSNILRNISLQFTGIFYLHLHSYSSLANTWLSTRNRISASIVFHNPLYPQSSVLGCCSCALGDTVFPFPARV